MPRNPDLVYIPVDLDRDSRLSLRQRDTLMRLIACTDLSARCDLGLDDFARILGVSTRTAHKRLVRLQELGYISLRDGGIELRDDLVMREDNLLNLRAATPVRRAIRPAPAGR